MPEGSLDAVSELFSVIEDDDWRSLADQTGLKHDHTAARRDLEEIVAHLQEQTLFVVEQRKLDEPPSEVRRQLRAIAQHIREVRSALKLLLHNQIAWGALSGCDSRRSALGLFDEKRRGQKSFGGPALSDLQFGRDQGLAGKRARRRQLRPIPLVR